MEKPGQSVSSKNTSQRMFIGSDKISEIVNDSDLDGGNFSDSDTCEVNSPFRSSSNSSNNEEEEVIQPKPDRGRKRTHRALTKHADTDFELRWKEQIQMVQKPAFCSVPGINRSFNITEDSSPWDMYLKYS
jgi:hypothetical protein